MKEQVYCNSWRSLLDSSLAGIVNRLRSRSAADEEDEAVRGNFLTSSRQPWTTNVCVMAVENHRRPGSTHRNHFAMEASDTLADNQQRWACTCVKMLINVARPAVDDDRLHCCSKQPPLYRQGHGNCEGFNRMSLFVQIHEWIARHQWMFTTCTHCCTCVSTYMYVHIYSSTT